MNGREYDGYSPYSRFINKRVHLTRKVIDGDEKKIFYYQGVILDILNNKHFLFLDRKEGEMLILIDEVVSVSLVRDDENEGD